MRRMFVSAARFRELAKAEQLSMFGGGGGGRAEVQVRAHGRVTKQGKVAAVQAHTQRRKAPSREAAKGADKGSAVERAQASHELGSRTHDSKRRPLRTVYNFMQANPTEQAPQTNAPTPPELAVFGEITAEYQRPESRRSQIKQHQTTTTVRWTGPGGEPRSATWDPLARLGKGAWMDPPPPEAVLWKLAQDDTKGLPPVDPEVTRDTLKDWIPYSYTRGMTKGSMFVLISG